MRYLIKFKITLTTTQHHRSVRMSPNYTLNDGMNSKDFYTREIN